MKVIFVLLLIFNNVIKAQPVKVVGIADGDTFTALFADNHTERIRLHGIDCPETGQPFEGSETIYFKFNLSKKGIPDQEGD